MFSSTVTQTDSAAPETLLIVDDDEMNRAILENIFAGQYRIEQAENGRQALDLVLVIQFDLGVAGVAWATMIAQGISAVMSFFVLIRELKKFSCGQAETFNGRELKDMTKIALPSILQQSTVSIGMMLVQSVVNSFGSEALAGFSAAMRIESICVVPMSGIGNAVSSYTAQNIGARQTKRVVEGFHAAIRMVIVCAVVICAVLELFHGGIISLFLGAEGTETAIATGENYLIFMGWFFCLFYSTVYGTADAIY